MKKLGIRLGDDVGKLGREDGLILAALRAFFYGRRGIVIYD